ncbi:uncharacterized protein LOC117647695 [Thrips palmi]|uniref:Uncharacterized protein LOC117647695 n=1 Tax=Thrips palmi TaxID=161013 RepID=A0A6P8Z6C4_THRPL|nr:uncharacterized protein LOC117647695 [Thrips palmi]
MAEGLFSVFPDGQLTAGHGLKGNVPRSKKKALCDVKNTLQSKRTGLNEPLRKLNLDQGEGSCKQTVKETPLKVTSKQEGTFKIACDKENEIFWDKCNDCDPLDDELFNLRPESSRLKNEDIEYLGKGFFCPEQRIPVLDDDLSSYKGLRSNDWFDHLRDCEVDFPPLPPVEIEDPVLLFSDDE